MPKRLFSIARKKEKVGAKIRSLFSPGWPKDQALRLLTCILVLLTYVAATDQANADSTPTIPKACKPEKNDPNHVDKHGNDIAVIIDNREHARQPAAREDVDALEAMLDRHLFADHIIKLERPSYPLICDIFGGCQEKKDDDDPWPPLVAQIVHGEQSRLYVYYLGPARLEGLERQLLFRRLQNPEDSRPGDVLAYPIERLHEQLAVTNPRSTLVMMDVSLATRVLPCASEDPALIDATMESVRRNYQTILQRRPPPRGAMELFAASPTEAAHCDRFDQLKEAVDRPLFTKFLLKAVVEGLANQAPFGDGSSRIELGEIEAYTGDKIQRAVQFQWGRRQTVWGRGSSTQPIAMVKPRSLTGDRCIEARRRWEKRLKEASTTGRDIEKQTTGNQEAGYGTANTPTFFGQPSETTDGKSYGSAATDELNLADNADIGDQREPAARSQVERCRQDPEAAGCHACDLDQAGPVCVAFCESNRDDLRCQGDITLLALDDRDAFCAEQPESEICPCLEGDRRAVCAGAWCRWTANNLAAGTVKAVEAFQGDAGGLCRWSAEHEGEVERGPLGQMLTPIFWRLTRSTAQDSVSCVLDCTNIASAGVEPETSEPEAAKPEAPPPDVAEPGTIFEPGREGVPPLAGGDQDVAMIEPAGSPTHRTALNREVCDQFGDPLPPYIGLPRWMPGTLMISEMLRWRMGCEGAAPPRYAMPPPVTRQAGYRAPDPSSIGDQDSDSEVFVTDEPEPEPEPGYEPKPEPGLKPEPSLSRGWHGGLPPPVALGAAPFAFKPTVSQTRWLQSALILGNHGPGTIDGSLGPQTMQAVRAWRRWENRPSWADKLTRNEFRKIVTDYGHLFGQVQQKAPSF